MRRVGRSDELGVPVSGEDVKKDIGEKGTLANVLLRGKMAGPGEENKPLLTGLEEGGTLRVCELVVVAVVVVVADDEFVE